MQRIALLFWYVIVALITVTLLVAPVTTAVLQVVQRVLTHDTTSQLYPTTTQDEIVPVAMAYDDEPVRVATRTATLASGMRHLCAVTQSAVVRCWGDNRAGQLGIGSDGTVLPYVTTPMQVSGLTDVTGITLGDAHTCALRMRTGNVWCWGDNQYGQLGNATIGPQTQQSVPQAVINLSDVTELSAGLNHTCALVATGDVWCWGDNRANQIARTDVSLVDRPTKIPLGLPATELSAGGDTTCAVVSDGSVWCWGANTKAQLPGNAQTVANPVVLVTNDVPVMLAVSTHMICGVTTAGTVWCTSPAGMIYPAVPAIQRIRAQSDGGICAVSIDAQVWCWDDANHPQAVAVSGAVDTASGSGFQCVLVRAAKVVCRGDNRYGQLGAETQGGSRDSFAVVHLGHTGAVMSGGISHFCALWQQGRVRCWGRNLEGQLGALEQRDAPVPVTPDINGVTRVATGGQHTCVIRYDNRVYCWGANDAGQLGVGTFQRATQPQQVWAFSAVSDITAGFNHTCALENTGAVWCWGDNQFHQINTSNQPQPVPTRIAPIPAVAMLASGGNTNCALRYDGTVVCWGEPLNASQQDFAVVAQLNDIIDVQIGWHFACALQNTGLLWCWGGNDPTNSDTILATPHIVSGMPKLRAMSVGGNHVCGIDGIHQLWCVGKNTAQQVDRSSTVAVVSTPLQVMDGVSHVSLGFATTCARLQIGRTTCWGDGSYGQLGTGEYEYDAANPYVDGLNDGYTIATGGNFSCTLLKYVAARCWGGNEYGQLGDGTTNTASLPQSVRSNDEFVEIATGNAHACAIVSDGTVRCWGHNNYGQLGNETTEDSNTPVIAAVQSVVGISLGQSHSCALLQDGGGACWGRNDDGQLGSGNTAASGMPLRVAELATAIDIKAGGNHTCALLQDTSVRCWGRNQQGQLGIGDAGPGLSMPVVVPGLANVTQLSLGLDHTCALTSNGELYCWGWNRYGQVGMGIVGDTAYVTRPQLVVGINNIVQVSAGDNHTCVLQRNGEVRCWGDNYSGQLGVSTMTGVTASSTSAAVVSGLSNVVAVASGGAHTCALMQRGDVACWGWNNAGQIGNGAGGVFRDISTPQPIVGRLNATSIGVSAQHICMVDAVGTVWCWGDNTFGQLGIGSDLGTATRTLPSEVDAAANTVAVSLGADHTCALLVTNDLNCWGRNTVGQLGNSFSGDLADSPVPYFVGNFVGVTAFAAGGNQSCAIIASQVYCWGDNQYGQIANEPTGIGEFRTTPTLITQISNARDLVIGASHVCALLDTGQVSCWGRNNQHQLGSAGAEQRITPEIVPMVNDVIAFAAGDNHTCAVQQNGHVWCWGGNQSGQLGVVGTDITTPQQLPDISDAIAIAAGKAHTCVLTKQPAVKCWGDNTHMQIGNVDTAMQQVNTLTLSDPPQSIAAGGDRTCVIGLSTAVWCWGQNTNNFLGVTANPDRNTPVMVQQLWEMRVSMLPLRTPTPFATLPPKHPTATPRPTRSVPATATLIKRALPTPPFQRVPHDD